MAIGHLYVQTRRALIHRIRSTRKKVRDNLLPRAIRPATGNDLVSVNDRETSILFDADRRHPILSQVKNNPVTSSVSASEVDGCRGDHLTYPLDVTPP